jgi:hypothetical protein
MTQTKSLLLAVAVGALTFAAVKASAFPLYLTTLSGTVSYTPSYDALSDTNVAKYSTVAVNLKKMMLILSNEVFLTSGGTTVPADARLAVDPYDNATYLTNQSGFYYGLSSTNAYFQIYDIATSFKGNVSGGSEKDKVIIYFYIFGRGPDGLYYDTDVYGVGSLKYTLNGSTGSMTISLKGADYGEIASSDDGVFTGGITLKGSGTPEWPGAFSISWY